MMFRFLPFSSRDKFRYFFFGQCTLAASYPDVSLLMKMCAQRKAGRRHPSHCPLRFITSHWRFALASAMLKTKRLRRLVRYATALSSFVQSKGILPTSEAASTIYHRIDGIDIAEVFQI